MELLLFRPSDFERQYLNGCSRFRVDDVPLEERISVPNGTIFILLFFIVETLYIPCMFSIWKRMDNSCYKLLFYVGLTDMLVLWVVGFFTGYFALNGVVFCTNPVINYVLGGFGTSLWVAESIAELLLAIDRCLEMSYPGIAEKLFKGNRTWCWCGLISAYSLYWFLFTKPALFSSIYCAWFFNPFMGYLPDTENAFHHYLHSAHDTFMAFAFPAVYLLLGIRVLFMSRGASTAVNGQRNVAQKFMFLQVAIISAFNCYACILYVTMQYIQVTEVVILLAQYGWFFIHGIPPFIYLTINKTIRNDCRKMVASLLFQMANRMHHASSVSTVMPSNGGHMPARVHPNVAIDTFTNQMVREQQF